MAIIYPDIDSVGWGDDVNANFRELNQNDTDIKATIGTETIGTTATTLKGAIKEVKGIADNNTTQLNDMANDITNLGTNKIDKSKIINNASVTEEGFVADARQIKALKDEQYKTIFNSTFSSFASAYANGNGNYRVSNPSDFPSNLGYTQNSDFFVEIKKTDDDIGGIIIAYDLRSTSILQQRKLGGVWNPWSKII